MQEREIPLHAVALVHEPVVPASSPAQGSTQHTCPAAQVCMPHVMPAPPLLASPAPLLLPLLLPPLLLPLLPLPLLPPLVLLLVLPLVVPLLLPELSPLVLPASPESPFSELSQAPAAAAAPPSTMTKSGRTHFETERIDDIDLCPLSSDRDKARPCNRRAIASWQRTASPERSGAGVRRACLPVPARMRLAMSAPRARVRAAPLEAKYLHAVG
jgi:hypothetical protein